MKSKAKQILLYFVLVVVGLYFSIVGLVAAKGLLAPLSVAVLLAVILLPLANKLEKWGISRGFSAFLSVLVTLLFFCALTFVVALQIGNVASDWPKIEKRLKPKVEQMQEWISEKTGLNPEEQTEMVKSKLPGGSSGNSESSDGDKNNSESQSGDQQQNSNQQQNQKKSSQGSAGAQQSSSSGSSGGGGMMNSVGGFLMGMFSFLGNSLLALIYIFFFLLYRSKIKKSILKFFPRDRREEAHAVLQDSAKLSQNYLLGRLLLILFLIIIYSIGLNISGIENAILISVLAAFLSLLPYIGNVIGFTLAVAMAAFSGGDMMAFVGIGITFTVAQFVESYILEPYVVGDQVDLNPLVTIIVVVIGGAVWGIAGMIISIPVFGVLKIIFDKIRVLNPLGYALGQEDIGAYEKEGSVEKWLKKMKNKFK